MITGLDHVAIAVPDLKKAISRFLNDIGLTYEGSEDVVSANTTTAFFPISAATSIELVHPLEGGGPIAKYIEKNGGGIHHICFRSNDVVADMARLKEKGYQLLSDEPKPGAHDTKTVFIHPKSCGGILIEIAEHTHGEHAAANQATG